MKLIRSLAVYVLLWAILIYVYGSFILVDDIVPDTGIDIDEWMQSFYLAGGVSALIGFICTIIWHIFGSNFSGDTGITGKFYALWIVSVIGSFIAEFVIVDPSQEGAGLAFFFVVLLAPLGFYLNALFNSAEAVKFIPPLGEKLHG